MNSTPPYSTPWRYSIRAGRRFLSGVAKNKYHINGLFLGLPERRSSRNFVTNRPFPGPLSKEFLTLHVFVVLDALIRSLRPWPGP